MAPATRSTMTRSLSREPVERHGPFVALRSGERQRDITDYLCGRLMMTDKDANEAVQQLTRRELTLIELDMRQDHGAMHSFDYDPCGGR